MSDVASRRRPATGGRFARERLASQTRENVAATGVSGYEPATFSHVRSQCQPRPKTCLLTSPPCRLRPKPSSIRPFIRSRISQALRGDIPGGHTKNLFVKDKKSNLFLLVLGETTAIDLKRAHEKIGAQGRVSFGSAELLEDVWGVKPGAVTPFGAINDKAGKVSVVLDEAMMRHERLNFHPLVNTRTTGLKSADLVKFLRATGHEPLVVALG